MKLRTFGAGGPQVGAVGLGCMSFAGAFGATDEATSHRTLAAAREAGITHLDTANVYGAGLSEEIIGRFLKGSKGDFHIATKAGITRTPDGTRLFSNDPAHVTAELEGSLKRLGIEHVDVFYMHRRDPSVPLEVVMDTLLRLKDAGKIGGIGFSEIAPSTLRMAAALGPVTAVQNEYSIWTRYPELGLIQACEEVGATFVPFSPVARGMASDKPLDPATFGKGDLRQMIPRFSDENFPANQAAFDRLRALAGDLSTSPATLAIAWILDQGAHLIPIPGTRTPEHLLQLAAAADFDFTDDVRAALHKIMPPGFAHGDRYNDQQLVGIERYC